MTSESRPTVVCVGFDPDEVPEELAGVLATCACVHHGDVYRALARLQRDDPALVIVDVTWLPSVAFEFFEVVARGRRELPVFVVGDERANERIADACKCGARGRATPEAIVPWLSQREAPAVSLTEQPPRGVDPVGNKSDTFAPAGNVFDAELDRRLQAQADTDLPEGGLDPADDEFDELPSPQFVERESDGEGDEFDGSDLGEHAGDGPRVPWLRYTDQPKRTPPKRVPPQRRPPGPSLPGPPKVESAKVEPPPASSVVSSEGTVPYAGQPPKFSANGLDLDPPLLTAEEIAALMGDRHRSED